MPDCWSGCVVESPAELLVVGQYGKPRSPNWQVWSAKYGPTTRKDAGSAAWVASCGAVPASRLSQISSRPNASRVGTPLPLAIVGSGLIHMSYQDWTPGP